MALAATLTAALAAAVCRGCYHGRNLEVLSSVVPQDLSRALPRVLPRMLPRVGFAAHIAAEFVAVSPTAISVGTTVVRFASAVPLAETCHGISRQVAAIAGTPVAGNNHETSSNAYP